MSNTNYIRNSSGGLPNLLMVIIDQQRAPQHFDQGWVDDNLRTMNLLKRHGVSFPNGFCNTCMCSPSRSTLFTSLHPAQHGVTDTLTFGGKFAVTQTDLDNTIPNMASLLGPDYDVQYRGKFHLRKGGSNDFQAAENALMAAQVATFGWKGWQSPDAGQDTKLENFGGGYAAHDARYVGEAIEFIKEWQERKNRDPNTKPFFLTLSLVNPHDVLSYPQFYREGGYDDDDLDGPNQPPPTARENLTEFKPTAQEQAKVGMTQQFGPVDSDERMSKYVNFYANLQALIDKQLSELFDLMYPGFWENPDVEPNDLAKDTLVIRLADHGEMGMAHGGLRQKSYNIYEETLRVPLIFSSPWFEENGFHQDYMTSQMMGLIDVLPTLGGALGISEQLEERRQLPPGDLRVDRNEALSFKGMNLGKCLLAPDIGEVSNPLMFTYDDVGAPIPTAPPPIKAANRVRAIRTHNWKFARYFHADSSYPDEFEMYWIKGINEDGQVDDESAALTDIDNVDDASYEAWLNSLNANDQFETANLANPNYLETVPAEYADSVKKSRAQLEQLLHESEQALYAN